MKTETTPQILVCYAPLRMELSNHKMEVVFCYSFWLPVLTTVTFGYIILKNIINKRDVIALAIFPTPIIFYVPNIYFENKFQSICLSLIFFSFLFFLEG